VLLLVFAGVGCSDDQSRERAYARGVLDAKESVDEAYQGTKAGLANDGRVDAADLDAFATAAHAAHLQVRGLDPPDDLRREDRKIVDDFARIDSSTARLARSSGSADVKERTVARDALIAAMSDLEDQLAKLRARDR
jgi:hypothetical protein